VGIQSLAFVCSLLVLLLVSRLWLLAFPTMTMTTFAFRLVDWLVRCDRLLLLRLASSHVRPMHRACRMMVVVRETYLVFGISLLQVDRLRGLVFFATSGMTPVDGNETIYGECLAVCHRLRVKMGAIEFYRLR
jgi:hypothetical protein